ncbi:hypothetical protein JHW43_004393 [Diplocarpon mali]|nr:hypothetical protein JHW43_004393 [Diplocarpon mali]
MDDSLHPGRDARGVRPASRQMCVLAARPIIPPPGQDAPLPTSTTSTASTAPPKNTTTNTTKTPPPPRTVSNEILPRHRFVHQPSPPPPSCGFSQPSQPSRLGRLSRPLTPGALRGFALPRKKKPLRSGTWQPPPSRDSGAASPSTTKAVPPSGVVGVVGVDAILPSRPSSSRLLPPDYFLPTTSSRPLPPNHSTSGAARENRYEDRSYENHRPATGRGCARASLSAWAGILGSPHAPGLVVSCRGRGIRSSADRVRSAGSRPIQPGALLARPTWLRLSLRRGTG